MRIRAIIWPVLAILIATGSCRQQEQPSDLDGDGIPDTVEMELGYDYLDADSDDDGIPDGAEDWNWNGHLDAGEADPLDPDTDDDGMCDGPRRDNEGDGMAPEDPCTFPRVWYVKWSPVGFGPVDGRSWLAAFATLQQALSAASDGDHIWVAGGTYYPREKRASVLSIYQSVRIYGGFHGFEPGLWRRPSPLAPTTLSGDALLNDFLERTGDNSEEVVEITSATNVLLDGFTVTGGAGDIGSGIRIASSDGIVLSNLTIVDNHAVEYGGGIAATESEVRIVNSRIEGNSADVGGGLWLAASLTEIEGSEFIANQGYWSGGIQLDLGDVFIYDSEFRNNVSRFGAGIDAFGDTYLLNTKFIGNMATTGGVAINNTGDLIGVNILVADNRAIIQWPETGAAIDHSWIGNMYLAHATIANNWPSGIADGSSETLQVDNSILWGNGDPGSNLVLCNPYSTECPWENRRFRYTCSSDDLETLLDEDDGPDAGVIRNGVHVAGNPFDVDPETGYLYLNPDAADTGCIDAGSNEIADAAIGAGAWRGQSTRIDGMSEAETDGGSAQIVDTGIHY